MTAIYLTWPAETSPAGEVSRRFTAIMRTMSPYEYGDIALRAQDIARERAVKAGATRAWVTMADLDAALAGVRVQPEVEQLRLL